MRGSIAAVVSFVVCAVSGNASRAHAQDPPRREAIEAELARHEQDILRLRRELEERRAPATPLLRFSGYVQTDWVVMRQSSQDEINGSSGQPLNENRFTLRRGHLRADAERGLVTAALEIDANTVNGPLVRPINAEASIRWPEKPREGDLHIKATIGLFKTPFGFEVLEADNRRPFLERSAVIRAMFPGEFDLGARIQGGWRFFDYAVGLMNGDPIGERQFPGRDPNKSKDLVFRAGVHAKPATGWRVEAGFSGVNGTGFHKGTPSTKDVLVWRDADEDGIVQQTEIQVIPGSAATASQNFHRFGIGGDLRVHIAIPRLGDLTLRGEIVWASNLDRGLAPADPVALGRDVREFGWYLGATQELTKWAMVGARYDRYNPDADASNTQGATLVPKDASFATISIMAMARYETARFIGQYDHNTNALGRSTAGLPTTLADDTLTLRGEVSF